MGQIKRAATTMRKEIEVDQSESERGVPSSSTATGPANVDETLGPMESLPKELGVLLVVAGIGGLLLPGPVGTPFLIVGGVILWPAAFKRVERCFHKRMPRMHAAGMKQMKRFVTDLERRYPWTA
jgi:hypothetical protein